jgi:serine/threonine protein kinase/Tfp pilus assembly protein PilF
MKDSLLPGTSISHYRILSQIGAGGMGEVYLAEDTRLRRKIALKVLLGQLAHEEDRLRRFEQEARAASALNHPNIITIHEVGSDAGVRYIAMEYIEGETVRQRLRHGKIGQREAIEVAIQVANALAAAHQAGIVHRDIKPENVMLRPDGYVKVLDFGVVKLTEKFVERTTGDRESSGEEAADVKTITIVSTEANVVMGSPNYMSPEQARGLQVDGRTDIFSLGALIYEMITGTIPFDGPSVSDIIVSILERQPPPVSSVTPEASPRLVRIVEKAMAKDRGARYQTAAEILAELKKLRRRLDYEAGLDDSFSGLPDDATASLRADQDTKATILDISRSSSEIAPTQRKTPVPWSAEYIFQEIKQHGRGFSIVLTLAVAVMIGSVLLLRSSGSHPIDSIAVLPFANEGGDQNTEYLSDGITESLINNLSNSPRLKVVSRNSAFRYKGRDIAPKVVGRELGVRVVLTGRIIQRGDSLQISVDLVDARDDTQIWGEQYNRKMSALVVAQEEIARRVAEKLELRLSGVDQTRISKQGTDNAEAYQLYLRGRYYWNKRTEEGLRRGIEFFNKAIELDPSYSKAYAGVADCYAMLTEYSAQPPMELYPRVQAAARKALEIDDSLAEAHTSLAAAYEYQWAWSDAEREYRRAIELNPNYATAHQWYGVFLSSHLRHEEAISQLRKALELDPLSLIINTSMGRALYGARRYDDASEQLRKTVEMDPNFPESRFQLAMVYEGKKMYREALGEFEKCVELFNDPAMKVWLGRVYAVEGRRGDAERVIAEMNELAKTKYISPYPMATIYAALGQNDRALELLEKVFEEHSYYVVWLGVDPVFDGIRKDPRFFELTKKIGLGQGE